MLSGEYWANTKIKFGWINGWGILAIWNRIRAELYDAVVFHGLQAYSLLVEPFGQQKRGK